MVNQILLQREHLPIATFQRSTCKRFNVSSIYLLSFQTLAHSFALFRTFLHLPKAQPFSFQPIPHSFAKTSAGGCALEKKTIFAWRARR
jgi:hypothetical protein